MALITPPELLETQPYPFQRLRHMYEHMVLQEGVASTNSFAVSERAAGANMSVDVASGACWIKGDSGTRQGLYHLVNDAVVNVAVPAAHATLPRLDQVIARIFDSSVSGGSDLPTLEVLAGTPDAAASLNGREGAASLPADALRLADIRTSAADTAITETQIRSRRPAADGAHAVRLGGGGGDITTTSTSFTNTGLSGFDTRIECAGVPIEIIFHGRAAHTVAGGLVTFRIMDNGSEASAQRTVVRASAGNASDTFTMMVLYTPTSGSHLFTIEWALGLAGTGTLFNSLNEVPRLRIREVGPYSAFFTS